MTGIPIWARVGAKCVCVDASGTNPFADGSGWREDAPTVGAIYTISATWIDEGTGAPVAEFVELQRSSRSCDIHGAVLGYGIYRFRPLVTLEDDITTYFAELLTTPVRVEEEA